MENLVKRYSTALLVALSLGISGGVYADEQRTEGLNFELTPYVWFVGLDGEVNVRNASVNFNRSFSDIIKNTDAGFLGLGVISYNRFVLYADYDYLSLSDNAKTKSGFLVPPGTKAQADISLDVGTYAGGYRFNTFGKNTIDVLFGAQLTNIDEKLKVLGLKAQNKESLTDYVVMLRPSFQISEHWRFNPAFDYGVSGDSDTTYMMMPQVQYQFSDSFALRVGYKKLHYTLKNGNSGDADYRKLDTDISGPFLGVGWTFPARKEHVAAAPPPPAPVAKPAPIVAAAPPAKCADADHDGVCDAADQCPNTPAGKRVDAVGCDCDYTLRTHFAFNSAELTAEDKAELDQLASTMMNPKLHFVAGEIDGYTDSVGKPEYNLALSKRRADAVANYLKSKGVALGDRFVTRGLGAADPIADNKTEEGRAQNRRTTIRRTDCK